MSCKAVVTEKTAAEDRDLNILPAETLRAAGFHSQLIVSFCFASALHFRRIEAQELKSYRGLWKELKGICTYRRRSAK